MKAEIVDLFMHWIIERETVRAHRERGDPPPWTDDPIIAKYHFCNVHREHDRGTIEQRLVYHDLVPTFKMLPTFFTVARMFNDANTLRLYWEGGPPAVKAHRDAGNTVFNTAYVVSTCGVSMDKVDYVDNVVRDVSRTTIRFDSCESAYQDLRNVSGLGSFMAGQIVADLKYTRFLGHAPDFFTFAVMGPGSKKGMDYIMGGGTTERNFFDRLVLLRNVVGKLAEDIHNQDLQNCLCEFSKYMRLRNNENGRRRPYHAHT